MNEDDSGVSRFQLIVRTGHADKIFTDHCGDQAAWQGDIFQRCLRDGCPFDDLNFPDFGIAL